MSWHLVSLAYRKAAGSSARKSVLVYCADKASDDGAGIWASKATIAAELELGRSTIIRVFNDFVSEGLLDVTGQRKCTNGATVEYRLNEGVLQALPSIKTPVPQRDQSHSDTSSERDPSHSGTPPVPQRDPKACHSGTQTSLEPPLNPKEPPLIPPSRKSRMSEGAEITSPMRQAADKRGHSQQEAEAQFEKFKNDALAKGKSFVSWDRAFVTWLDSEYFRPIIAKEKTHGSRLDGTASEAARRAGERWAARDMDRGPGPDVAVTLLPPR